MHDFDAIVVGNGLIGGAAARYLSEWGLRVAVVGPGEPADPAVHTGVFSSHYDQGRLTRELSRDPVWSVLARQAVKKYALLEARSGVRFHGPVGRVHAGRPTQAERQHQFQWLDDVATSLGIEYRYYEAGDRSWKARFPFLEFPADYDLFYEPAPAGYVNPRQMLRAQNVIAEQLGARRIDDYAIGVETDAQGVGVTTAGGERLRAGKALIACGAFTNFNNLLPAPIPLRLKTESMIWGDVSPATAERLAAMPGIGYDIEDPDIDDIYMAPPLRYPDGRWKIKMGCNSANEQWPQTLAEVQAWFRAGPSHLDQPAMARALQRILPDVEFERISSHRCIVTYTPSGYPTVDQVPDEAHGRLFVATGGNGTGAQGSDTLGHLAAGLLHDGRWMQELPRDLFQARTQWGASRKALTKAQTRAMEK